jgi:putative membrane protein
MPSLEGRPMTIARTAALLGLIALAPAAALPAAAFAAPSPVDQAFTAKVSQGGMFEVEAGKLAENKAQAQDVKDFGVMEVHDHTLVGEGLKKAADHEGIKFSDKLNPEFQGKLDKLKGMSGHAFDVAYMDEMADLHAKDGASFAKEATDSPDMGFKTFAGETHRIVQRHIGAIHAAPPPAK